MRITGFRGLAIAVTALMTMSVDALAAKRVALVIGNSSYQSVARLPNPSRDATAIADLFKKAGFDVVSLQQDAGNLEFKRAIRRFEDQTRDSDVAVVFYAGHGIEIGDTNYMIPVDAKLASDLDAQDEAITLERIVDSVEPARQLRLVILDACRDNPFVTTMKRQRQASLRAMTSGLGKVEPTHSGTLIAYAAKAGSTADDGVGSHSPFTTALLNHLTSPGLDIRLALGRVRDDVMRMTNQRQEPFVYGSLGGATVALVPSPEAAAPKVVANPAVNDPNADARRDYEYFERVGTRDAWEAFLKMYSTGIYAELAKAQLAKITAAQGQRAPVVAAVSTPPKPDTTSTPPASGPAPGEVARMLQTELARVGCYSGSINGEWNASSRRALDAFSRNANARLDGKSPSLESLDAVRDKQYRVCPIECDRNFKASGDQCVRVACDSGFTLNDKGNCDPVKNRAREATRSQPEPQQRQRRQPDNAGSGRAAQGGGGAQFACDRFACRPVPKGCSVRSSTFQGEQQQVVICN